MAQFKQTAPQDQATGLGGQQIVQSNMPNLGKTIESITSSAEGTLNAAGQIWAKNKAQDLVNNSISSVDSAVAAAQRQNKENLPADIANPNVPDGVNVSSAQFRMIANAVKTGSLSREKAKLLVSSKLRSAIAEQPLFANQLRKDASSVLGFNITSEPATEYFNSYKTATQIAAESSNSYGSKTMQKAEGMAAGMSGVPVKDIYDTLVQSDYAQARKKEANAKLSINAASSQEWASEWQTADATHAWADVLHSIAAPTKDGKAVDDQTVNARIEAVHQQQRSQFIHDYQAHGGIVGSPQFAQELTQFDQRYKGYKDFVNQIGIDNLQKVKINRLNNAYKIMGSELTPKLMFYSQAYGQRIGGDVLTLFSNASTPSQRQLLLDSNPALKQVYDATGGDTKEGNAKFLNLLNDTTKGILSGTPPTSKDQKAATDGVAHDLYNNGNQPTKDKVLEGLEKQGTPYKSLSLLASNYPTPDDKFGQKYFTRMYKTALPQKMNELANALASIPNVSWSVDNSGMIQVQPSDQGNIQLKVGQVGETGAQTAQASSVDYQHAQALASQLNQFAKGFKHGWGAIVGENLDQYKSRLNSGIQKEISNYKTQQQDTETKALLFDLKVGNIPSAKKSLEILKTKYPNVYTHDIDWYMQKAREQLNNGS